ILNTRQPVEDILGFMMQHDDKIENVNIYFEDLSVKPAIRKTLEPLEEFATVTTSFDTNWEMGGLTTSKAEGLRVLSEILGVEKEEMMAFGDSPNDIPMIEAAGIGVAVENAKDSVKQAADFVTTSNDDAGVAVAVRKFALRK
ncbi:MAG: HAD hydrolase family protein, partial [Anaerovoracaceae bacterium]|nr:HAD hydrolase family protein [Anaerovoracaceae bacterium]